MSIESGTVRRFRLWRVVPVVITAAAAAAVLWWRTDYRQIETVLAGWVSGPATASRSIINAHTETIFLNVGTPKVFGLVVTPVCSSAVISGLVLAVTALVMALPRFTVRRALLAAVAAAGGFALLNLARIVMIAVATDKWGLGSGYHWSHEWAGTFVTVFGGVAAAAVYLVVLGGGPSGRPVVGASQES